MGLKGRLTTKEKDKIREMVLAGHTDVQISKELKRAVPTIKLFRDNEGLKKTAAGKLIVKEGHVKTRDIINKGGGTQEDKIRTWEAYFKGTKKYKSLKNQYTEEDLEEFVYLWAVWHESLDDLTPAEEDVIENMLALHIRLKHNRRNYKSTLEREEMIRDNIGGSEKQLDLEDEDDRFFFDLIMSNNRDQQEINKEHNLLLKEFNSLQESLNVTRKQREERQKIGADTFFTLCKQFNDRDKRNEANRYNELMKASRISKTEKMKQPYEFADGTVEPVLLDGADFIKKDKRKSNE